MVLSRHNIATQGGGLISINYNTRRAECQEDLTLLDCDRLVDKSPTGRERPWRKYKIQAEILADAYAGYDDSKAARLRQCDKSLTFEVDDNNNMRLVGAESCRVRLCPLCSWRRSLKSYYNAAKIVQYLWDNDKPYRYIFVTLTIKNCTADNLPATLDTLFKGVKLLNNRKDIKQAWLGQIRNLEVTHNINRDSKDFDTYHPHIHCLVAVAPDYFNNHYISQRRLTELWQQALGVEYTPIVDIRKVRGQTDCGGVELLPAADGGELPPHKAIAEVSKYATKPGDIIVPDDWDLTVDAVKALDYALANRRLINYSGVCRAAKKALNLEDAEDGDLINVGDDTTIDSGTARRVYYWWYSGVKDYYKISY